MEKVNNNEGVQTITIGSLEPGAARLNGVARPVSLASQTSNVSQTGSVFRLISSPKSNKKLFKCRNWDCKSRTNLLILIVILILGILTMAALLAWEEYRYQKLHKSKSQSLITTETNPGQLCMIKPDPIPLQDIPKEVKDVLPGLDKDLEKEFKERGLKAVSIGLTYRGKFWYRKNLGKLNYTEPNSPLPDGDTPYPIASVSKVFTALMMQKLLDDGKIRSLDDAVKKYLPLFKINSQFDKENITLRMLSCMMAGLPREAPCHPELPHNFCPNNSSVMFSRISNMSLFRQPDTLPSYSNLGYGILGSALAKQTKNGKLELWVQENILTPLKMYNTGFHILNRTKDIPVSTNGDGSIALIKDWGWLNPTGGMFSSVRDLCEIGNVLLEMSNSTVLKPTTARRMLKPAYISANGDGQGCPFEVENLNNRMKHSSGKPISYILYNKNGNTLGYGAQLITIPDLKMVIVVLVANSGREFTAAKLTDLLVKAIVPVTEKLLLLRNTSKYTAPENPSAYTGVYDLTSRWPLITKPVIIFQKNGELFLEIQWLTVALTQVKPWLLKMAHVESLPFCEEQLIALGMANTELIFTPPESGSQVSSKFTVSGISLFGHASFKRKTTATL